MPALMEPLAKEGTVITQSIMIVAISRPVEQVFAFVANAETAPQWQEETLEVRRASTGPIGLGTTFQALRSHLREQVSALLEITEYEPNKCVSFESAWGNLLSHDSYLFQSVGACTRVSYTFDLASRAPGTRRVFSREAADLSNLKDVLEALGRAALAVQRAADGGWATTDATVYRASRPGDWRSAPAQRAGRRGG